MRWRMSIRCRRQGSQGGEEDNKDDVKWERCEPGVKDDEKEAVRLSIGPQACGDGGRKVKWMGWMG